MSVLLVVIYYIAHRSQQYKTAHKIPHDETTGLTKIKEITIYNTKQNKTT